MMPIAGSLSFILNIAVIAFSIDDLVVVGLSPAPAGALKDLLARWLPPWVRSMSCRGIVYHGPLVKLEYRCLHPEVLIFKLNLRVVALVLNGSLFLI